VLAVLLIGFFSLVLLEEKDRPEAGCSREERPASGAG
jgi:hypothetical protein